MNVSTKQRLTGLLFSEKLKKWVKVIFYVTWFVFPSVYFWSNSTVCTAVEIELKAEGRLAKSKKDFPVSTVYEYTHRDQPYAVEVTRAFSSPQKGKQWIGRNPIGSESGCLVGFFNPESITLVPLGFPFFHEMLGKVFYPACGLLLLMVFGLMKMYFPFGLTFGPQIQYEKLSHPALEEPIQTRYQDEIAQLHKLGFQDFCLYCEVLPNYSAVWAFLEYFQMRKSGEITRVQSPFRLTLLHPLLVLPGEATYAAIYAKGMSFYMRLNNGTAIITRISKGNPSWNFSDHKRKLEVRSTEESIPYTWDYHRERVENFRGEEFLVSQEKSFEDFADMAARMDESVLKERR